MSFSTGFSRKVMIVIVCVTAAVVAVLGLLFWNYMRDNKIPAFNDDIELYVYPETSVDDVIAQLTEGGKLKWPSRIRHLFEEHKVPQLMKPGHYVTGKDSPAVLLARTLNNGWQTPVKVVLSGSLRDKGEISRKLSRSLMLDSASVHRALDNDSLLSKYGVTPSTVYSILMADTYEMWWTATVEDLLDKQSARVNAFWSDENLRKAGKLGLNRLQVSILASIVCSETNYAPEMPLVAGVYLNRLRRGMKLQADPTIAFCYDYKVNRILKKMLAVDSPYNTYKYAGLPPGPICIPSGAALNAVLNPDYGNGNLFFCADPSFNGSHRFTSSYAEHRRNARAFSRALDKLQRKQ